MFESTKSILPELILIITAFYLTLRSASGKASRDALFTEALIGSLSALIVLFFFSGPFMGKRAFFNLIELDHMANFFRFFFMGLLVFIIIMTLRSEEVGDYVFGEYLVILVSVTAGMCFLAEATDLLMVYLALEWISLSSYLLTALIAHKRTASEAGMKYVLFGGIASGVMLFGMSWLFGVTGTLKLDEIAGAFSQGQTAIMIFALVLILIGLAFKVAAVPLHFWAPDVYEAAPTPVTTFFSIGPKAAGFAILIRFFYYSLFHTQFGADVIENLPPGLAISGGSFVEMLRPQMETILAVLAALTMTVGNLLAVKQDNIKRLLAYSSVSHAGYLLMGVAALSSLGVQALLFYLFTYLLMNGGAFFIVNLTINRWKSEDISDYQGMAWRGGHHTFVALFMSVFLFSLAGIPPFAGFIGKWYIFAAVVEKKMYWLIIVALVNIVIALYYYARIVKAMYLNEKASEKSPFKINLTESFWLVSLGGLTIYFGIFFSPFFSYLKEIIH